MNEKEMVPADFFLRIGDFFRMESAGSSESLKDIILERYIIPYHRAVLHENVSEQYDILDGLQAYALDSEYERDVGTLRTVLEMGALDSDPDLVDVCLKIMEYKDQEEYGKELQELLDKRDIGVIKLFDEKEYS